MLILRTMGFATLYLCGLFVFPIQAHAGEVRIGIMKHDVDIPNITIRPVKEQSTSITGEYIFDTPNWPAWTLGARPYVYGSINLEGKTNHGGAGLYWRQHITSKFYAEFGGGLSLHSGTKRIEFPSQSDFPTLTRQQRIALITSLFARTQNEIQFGSDALFRAQIAVGYDFSDKWGADIVYEHLSNGQILGGPENGGLDSIGMRLSRKF